MSMTGEVVLSVDEQTAFSELEQSYGAFDSSADLAIGGLTAVMARVQGEAAQQVAAGGEVPVVVATRFQSAY